MSGYKQSSSKAGWGTGIALVVVAGLVAVNFLTVKESKMAATAHMVAAVDHELERAERASSASKQGGYEVLDGCRLADHRHNDGDSFHITTADGKDHEIRLYYVDTPESYRHQHNGERISHQAKYFKLANSDAAVELGKDAKKFVHKLLRDNGTFAVLTKWEPVFDSGRYFAFVQIEHDGKKQWLHEVLVKNGFARIYTQGAEMPDGQSVKSRKRQLKQMEESSRAHGVGGWE